MGQRGQGTFVVATIEPSPGIWSEVPAPSPVALVLTPITIILKKAFLTVLTRIRIIFFLVVV